MKLFIRGAASIAAIMLLVAAFQNCSPGFNAQTMDASSEVFSFKRDFEELNNQQKEVVCPRGWICFNKPLYTSALGAWYLLYWNAPGKAFTHWKEWTRFEPVLGYYSSSDPNIINHHLSQMTKVGIDYIIMDQTNGIGNDGGTIWENSQAFMQTNQIAGRNKKPFAVATGAGLWAERSVAAQNREADEILVRFAQDPNYLKWDGKPLLVSFNGLQEAHVFEPHWSDPRFTVKKAAGAVDGKMPQLQQYAREGLWGWVVKEDLLYSKETMAVMPGWHTRHLGRDTTPVPRDNGQYYMNQWLKVIKHNPKNIVIVSWNDWGEECAIEPGYYRGQGEAWVDSYGTEVPDWYLKITEAYSKLRVGLIAGYYYKDENLKEVYKVEAGTLVLQNQMPRLHPVIVLPAGTLVEILNKQSPPTGETPTPQTREQFATQIRAIYQAVLERSADAGGLNYYVDQMVQGRKLAEIEKELMSSPEKAFLSFYKLYLGRAPAMAEINQHNEQINSNRMTLEELRIALRSSSSCIKDCLDPGKTTQASLYESQLKSAYLSILERAADSGGLQYYLNQMTLGRKLEEIKNELSQSNEKSFLGYYKLYLKRKPTMNEINNHNAALDSGRMKLDDIRVLLRSSPLCLNDCQKTVTCGELKNAIWGVDAILGAPGARVSSETSCRSHCSSQGAKCCVYYRDIPSGFFNCHAIKRSACDKDLSWSNNHAVKTAAVVCK